jgi:DNA-binding beta-propeller fold protein YncE
MNSCKNFKLSGCVFAVYIIIMTSLISTHAADAVTTNNMPATDLLGQYDGTSITTPIPDYTKFSANDGPNRLGMNGPEYITIDEVNHRLFVADSVNNRVLIYNLTVTNLLLDRVPDNVLGQSNFVTHIPNNTASGLSGPTGLAHDPTNNRLFVAEYSSNRIKVFDIATITDGEPAINVIGQSTFTGASSGNSASALNGPMGMFYDVTNKRLFVSEFDGHRIKVFNMDPVVFTSGLTHNPNAINIIGQADYIDSTARDSQKGLRAPRSIVYDYSYKRLFIAEAFGNRVKVFNADPAVLIPETVPGTINASDNPDAIGLIGQTIYTTSTSSNTINGLSGPRGLTYDNATNKLYVADTGNNRVVIYSVSVTLFPSGTTNPNAVSVLGQSNYLTTAVGNTQSGLNVPRGIAIDTTNKKLFVVENGGNRIKIFDVSANPVVDGQTADDLLGQYDNSVIANPTQSFTKSAINNGPNILGISGSDYVLVDDVNDRLYVSDYSNNRVLIYILNPDNSLQDRIPDAVIGQPDFNSSSTSEGQKGLNGPAGLAIDKIGKRLFVAERSGNRVKVFDVSVGVNYPDAISVLGQTGYGLATAADGSTGIRWPIGLAYDSTNKRLFVAEYNGNRVKVFDVTLITNGESAVNIIGQADYTGSAAADTQKGIRSPQGLAYDSSNKRLFVAEPDGNRVKVFNADPAVLIPETVPGIVNASDNPNAINVLGQTSYTTGFGIPESSQNGFYSPIGVEYDAVGKRLFVSEYVGNRIKIFNADLAVLVPNVNTKPNAVNILGQVSYTAAASGAVQNTQTGLNIPVGMSYDTTAQRLFVSEYGGNKVKIYSGMSASGVVPPALSIGTVTPVSGTTVTGPVIFAGSAGSAQPNATVTVANGVTSICTAVADASGAWACPSTAVPVGVYSLSITQVNQGDTVPSGDLVYALTVQAAAVVQSGGGGGGGGGGGVSATTAMVVEAQDILKSLKYLPGTYISSGVQDFDMRSALQKFQTDNKMSLSALDSTVLTALRAKKPASTQSSNTNVKSTKKTLSKNSTSLSSTLQKIDLSKVIAVKDSGEKNTEKLCKIFTTDIVKGVITDGTPVYKVQLFLNKVMDKSLPLDGIYTEDLKSAIKEFQEKYKKEILIPADVKPNKQGVIEGTGLWKTFTRNKVNQILCDAYPEYANKGKQKQSVTKRSPLGKKTKITNDY